MDEVKRLLSDKTVSSEAELVWLLRPSADMNQLFNRPIRFIMKNKTSVQFLVLFRPEMRTEYFLMMEQNEKKDSSHPDFLNRPDHDHQGGCVNNPTSP